MHCGVTIIECTALRCLTKIQAEIKPLGIISIHPTNDYDGRAGYQIQAMHGEEATLLHILLRIVCQKKIICLSY